MYIDSNPNHVRLVLTIFIMPKRASHPMAIAGRAVAILAAALIVLPGVLSAQAGRRAARPPRPTLSVDMDTRLLIVSPHPDDEVLAAGGLMQRLGAAHGTVRVVYLTD